MKIPEFNTNGKLPTGIHISSGQEFIQRFCSSPGRKMFTKPICDILDFAMDKGAVEVFVGGSFITANDNPNDIDCVIVFKEDKFIPSQTEHILIEGLKFDILFASLENRNIVDSFLKLFASGRYGENDIGIIQIDLFDRNEVWKIKHQPSESSFEIVKRAYTNRTLIDLNEKKGILVTVHGLKSRAEWNVDISPIASSQGWIFAPFVYETNNPDLLFNESKRSKVVDEFRHWIYDIQERYKSDVSIIAHSFGTYIIAAYITGFDKNESPPVCFNSLILTGSILNINFDWERYRGLSVGRVYNVIAPNDEYIKYMPESDLKKWIGMSKLFGKSGNEGFSKMTSMLTQSNNTIFTHTNTIKRDVIETKWMPFLNANKNALRIEIFENIRQKKNI